MSMEIGATKWRIGWLGGESTHLSIDIATKLNIDDVEQITSIAI